MREMISKSAVWIQKSAIDLKPEDNKVVLSDGTTVEYDYLIVGTGMVHDFGKIPGMAEAVEDENSGVISIYDFRYSDNARKTMQKSQSGRAIFTMPATPVSKNRSIKIIFYFI